MPTRKISISQLRKGMFIHELDIPWMQSPFLRHRRKISADNDIVLLKKAGVKQLTIDLSRGVNITDTDKPVSKNRVTATTLEPDKVNPDRADAEKEHNPEKVSPLEKLPGKDAEQSEQAQSSLKTELKVAKVLQEKIEKLVNHLSSMVKEGRPLLVETINPVIDEARDSLKRNDQALLTMLHMHRQDIKLSDHGFGVFTVVLPLAMRMGCTEAEVNELGLAALLHDTGWSRLPMHLLGKNKPYTSTELKLIHQHPGIIENVLNKSRDIPNNVKTLVKQHHEMNDGSGYPEKLKKASIHRLVEILQVADCYDETVHALTDKPGMLPANALKRLYQAAKKGFYSETVVSELIHVMGIYPLTSAVLLNTGEKGVVVEIDKQKPLQPRIQLFYDEDGKPCPANSFVNLVNQSDKENRSIIKVIDPVNKKEDPLGFLRVIDANLH